MDFQNITKMWRLLALAIFLWWLSTLLPSILNLAAQFQLIHTYELLFNRHIIFLIVNALILILFLLSRPKTAVPLTFFLWSLSTVLDFVLTAIIIVILHFSWPNSRIRSFRDRLNQSAQPIIPPETSSDDDDRELEFFKRMNRLSSEEFNSVIDEAIQRLGPV